MAQDVGMVWKCCGVIDSHLVWLVFWGFHPNMCLFSFRNFLWLVHYHFSSPPYRVNLLVHTGYLAIRSSWVWKDTLSEDNCTYSRIQAGTLIILPSSNCYLQWCTSMAVHAGSAHQWSRGHQQVSWRVWEEPEVCCMALNFLWDNSRNVQCGEVGILLHDLHKDQVLFPSVR